MKLLAVLAVGLHVMCIATITRANPCTSEIEAGNSCTYSSVCSGGCETETKTITYPNGFKSTSTSSRCPCGSANNGAGSSGACKDKASNCAILKVWCSKKPSFMKSWCCSTCSAAQPKPTEPAPQPTPEPNSNSGNNEGEVSGCLKSINSYRRLHRDTPDLKWSSTLAGYAQKYAEYLLKRAEKIMRENPNWRSQNIHILVHDPRNRKMGWGENLWMNDNWKTGNDAYYCGLADKSWYDEIKDYNPESASSTNGNMIGHYTQLVWKSSKEVGFGIAVGNSVEFSGNKMAFVVAKFTPPGNFYMMGKRLEYYQENVMPLK